MKKFVTAIATAVAISAGVAGVTPPAQAASFHAAVAAGAVQDVQGDRGIVQKVGHRHGRRWRHHRRHGWRHGWRHGRHWAPCGRYRVRVWSPRRGRYVLRWRNTCRYPTFY